MIKKAMLCVSAVVAMALAAPVLAGAAEITYPAGTRAPVGQQLTMTGTNVTWTSSTLGPLGCQGLNLNATIKVNNGSAFEMGGENSSPTQVGCYNREPSRPFQVTNFSITKMVASEASGPSGSKKNGTLSFTSTVDYPAEVVCKYTGTNLPFSYVSTASPAVITFEKASGITSTGGCGTATLDASFALHGPGSTTTPVVLH